MQELVGRLTALDAEATETLKVISYFDALIDGHASVDVLLRGAAILSGCAAGFTVDGRMVRVDASGARSPAGSQDGWPSHRFGDGGSAWVERDGTPHANDEMILERLAIALDIAVERTFPTAMLRRALETLIDRDSSPEGRLEAARRLHLDTATQTQYRVIATPASAPAAGPSIVIGSPAGHVRVAVRASDEVGGLVRTGIGLAGGLDELERSSASALTALRLTSRREPVLHADDLGSLLVLAEAADDGRRPSPDVQAVSALIHSQPRLEELLDAVASAESLREIAAELGLHHSTVQVKVASLTETLRYDIRSPRGRTRLALALALHRLATNHFE